MTTEQRIQQLIDQYTQRIIDYGNQINEIEARRRELARVVEELKPLTVPIANETATKPTRRKPSRPNPNNPRAARTARTLDKRMQRFREESGSGVVQRPVVRPGGIRKD